MHFRRFDRNIMPQRVQKVRRTVILKFYAPVLFPMLQRVDWYTAVLTPYWFEPLGISYGVTKNVGLAFGRVT